MSIGLEKIPSGNKDEQNVSPDKKKVCPHCLPKVEGVKISNKIFVLIRLAEVTSFYKKAKAKS